MTPVRPGTGSGAPDEPTSPPRPRRADEAEEPPADLRADRAGAAPGPQWTAAALLADALSAVAVGLAVVNAEWRLAYVNDALARLVGHRAGQLVRRSLGDVFPAMRGGVEAVLVRRTMEDGEARRFRVTQPGGGCVFEVRVTRSTGRQLVLEVRDATAVARLERQYERALESIGDALFIVDPGWRVTYWNAAAERLTGRARATVVGRQLWEAVPELADSRLEQAWHDAMVERTPRELSNWTQPEVHGDRVFDVRCYPVPDAGLLVLAAEVTEQRRHEAALAEVRGENALLHELADQLAHTPDSAALLRMLCEIVQRECDAAGAGVSAVQQDELVVLASAGPGLPEPGFRMPLAGSLTEVVVSTRRVQRQPGDLTAHEPLRRHFEADAVGERMIAPLVAYGQVVGALLALRQRGAPPFTAHHERRLRLVADHAALALWKSRLLEQAHAASEAKSNFLATVSHELRTPLTALAGYGELLADEILGPLSGEQREMVERMCTVTQQLAGMIDELLTFSSLETGRELVRTGDVASGDLLRSVVAVVEPLARQKGLALRLDVPDDAPLVRTDPDKARQILVNLAGNAVKFTEAGAVTLSVAVRPGEVRLAVADTGPGIAPADQARLFQPFTQLETGLTRRYGGSGLGLYVSSRLAGLLGGRIELRSRRGEGSVFELVLPETAGA